MIAHEPARLPDRRHDDAACSTARPARWRRSSKRRGATEAGGRHRLPSAADRRRHDAQQGRDHDRARAARKRHHDGALQFPRHRRVRADASTTATAKSTTCARWRVGRERRPDAQLWLAGFSFGSYVTLKCAAELKPGMLISIAPPVPVAAGTSARRAAGLPVAGDPGRGRRDRRPAGRVRLDRQPQACASRPNWCACPTPATSSIAA